MQETDPDLTLRRYLLGELPSSEVLAVESRLFVDDAYSEQLEMVENDLVDDYLYGDMQEEDRKLFTKNYLSDEQHQLKLKTAGELKASLARADKRWQANSGWFSWFRTDRTWWQVPVVAAAVLLLIFGGWIVIRTMRNSPPAGGNTMAVLLNTASPTRSQTSDIIKVAVPPDQTVELMLPLVDSVETGEFSATLIAESGRPILSRSGLPVKQDPGSTAKVVTLSVPSQQLSPQRYAIELSHRTASGPQLVRTYYLDVVPK